MEKNPTPHVPLKELQKAISGNTMTHDRSSSVYCSFPACMSPQGHFHSSKPEGKKQLEELDKYEDISLLY